MSRCALLILTSWFWTLRWHNVSNEVGSSYRLDTDHPSAAECVREDLDETLSVLGLNLPDALRRSLTTTNAAESLISSTRHVKGNVKRCSVDVEEVA